MLEIMIFAGGVFFLGGGVRYISRVFSYLEKCLAVCPLLASPSMI